MSFLTNLISNSIGQNIRNPTVDAVPFLSNPWNNGKQAQPAQPKPTGTWDPRIGGTTSGGGVLGASKTNPNAGSYAAPESAGSAKDAAQRQATLYGIETGIGSANDTMNRLGGQEDIGIANIGRDYQDSYNRLLGQRQMATADYNQNKTNQLNEYQSARNQSANRARSWMESAQRILGANGAGAGSTARYTAPQNAQEMAAEGNAAAQSTNNRNIIAIEQGHQRDEDQFTNAGNDLVRQRQQGENDLRSRIANERADLNNTIANLSGQRVLANGGDYKAAQAAAQPYTSRVSELLARIDALSATPAIQQRQVTLSRPDLSAYNYAQPEAPVVAQQDPSLNPDWARLLGGGYDDRQQYAYA